MYYHRFLSTNMYNKIIFLHFHFNLRAVNAYVIKISYKFHDIYANCFCKYIIVSKSKLRLLAEFLFIQLLKIQAIYLSQQTLLITTLQCLECRLNAEIYRNY